MRERAHVLLGDGSEQAAANVMGRSYNHHAIRGALLVSGGGRSARASRQHRRNEHTRSMCAVLLRNPDDHGREIRRVQDQGRRPHFYLMPGADPGEGFLNTTYQLYSNDEPAPGEVPTNKGFVLNFKLAIASDLAKHYKD